MTKWEELNNHFAKNVDKSNNLKNEMESAINKFHSEMVAFFGSPDSKIKIGNKNFTDNKCEFTVHMNFSYNMSRDIDNKKPKHINKSFDLSLSSSDSFLLRYKGAQYENNSKLFEKIFAEVKQDNSY